MTEQSIQVNRPRIDREYVLHWDLINETGVDKIDNYLYCLLNILKIHFDDDLKAAYLIGSYAHGGYASDSDIDICLIYKSGIDRSRETWSIIEHIGLFTGMMVDPMYHGSEDPLYDPLDESNCCTPVLRLALKQQSLLLLGDDIRSEIMLSPDNHMLIDVLSPALIRIRHTHGIQNGMPITYPLRVPNGETEDKGFGDFHSVTIQIMHLARALIFLKTNEFVFNKTLIDTLYGNHIGGPWTDLVHQICATRYTNTEDCNQHRIWIETCKHLTDFENYFLDQINLKGLAEDLGIIRI